MRLTLALLLAGCATFGSRYDPAVPAAQRWSDYGETMAAIECALRGRYPADSVDRMLEVTVAAVDPRKLGGWNSLYDRFTHHIAIRSDYRSARASSLRGEMFVNVASTVLDGYPDDWSTERWKAEERALNEAFSKCWEKRHARNRTEG